MQEFQIAILGLESERITLLDVSEVMDRLCSELHMRRNDRFFGFKTKQVCRKLDEEQTEFLTLAGRFLERATLYLEANFDFNDPILTKATCLQLNGPLQWDALETLAGTQQIDINQDKLYQDYTVLSSVFERHGTR